MAGRPRGIIRRRSCPPVPRQTGCGAVLSDPANRGTARSQRGASPAPSPGDRLRALAERTSLFQQELGVFVCHTNALQLFQPAVSRLRHLRSSCAHENSGSPPRALPDERDRPFRGPSRSNIAAGGGVRRNPPDLDETPASARPAAWLRCARALRACEVHEHPLRPGRPRPRRHATKRLNRAIVGGNPPCRAAFSSPRQKPHFRRCQSIINGP